MSFGYHGDPSASDVDSVRFLLGDTEEEDHEFEDEEISWALTQESDLWFAAALVADTGVARYSSKPTSQTIGETSVTYGERTTKFTLLAYNLRNNRRQMAVTPFFGGPTSSSIDTSRIDEDFVAEKTDVPEV